MTRIGLVVMTIALTSVGCLPESFVRDKAKPPAVRMQEQSPPPPVVNADGITPENAAEKARRLRQELEFDMKRRMAGKPEKPAEVNE